jgi:hypothetical protein
VRPAYPPPYPYYYAPPRAAPIKLATAGGVVVLVGGVLNLLMIAVYAAMFASFPGGLFFGYYDYYILVCGVIGAIFSVLAIVGGVMAIKKISFPMAIVGAVFCMIGGFASTIGFILGLLGLIFIAISSHEFRPLGHGA